MSSVRWVLVRLAAVGFALAALATTGAPDRAPQALRGWMDVACQVQQAAETSSASPSASGPQAAPPAPSLCLGKPQDLGGALRPPDVTTSVTSAWPTSWSGREVLARKHALLI